MCFEGNQASTTQHFDNNGNLGSYDYGYGPNGGTMYNPGMLDPSNLNPSMAPYLHHMEGMASDFSNGMGKTLDPNFYSSMRDEFGQRAVTGVNNQYARMGLAGSSAEAGAAQNALRTNDMQWHDRQLGDQIKALQAGTMIDKSVMGSIGGIQGQYGQFQNQYYNDMMGLTSADQQRKAAEDAMFAQIISGVAMGGGYAAGGGFGGGGGAANGASGGA